MRWNSKYVFMEPNIEEKSQRKVPPFTLPWRYLCALEIRFILKVALMASAVTHFECVCLFAHFARVCLIWHRKQPSREKSNAKKHDKAAGRETGKKVERKTQIPLCTSLLSICTYLHTETCHVTIVWENHKESHWWTNRERKYEESQMARRLVSTK